MSDIEEIKKQKLEQMQAGMQQQALDEYKEQAQLQNQINMLEQIVKQKLSKEALERYGNIKTSNPEKAIQILAVLGQILQTKNVSVISDKEFKELIMTITPKKKSISIRRK